VGTALSLRLAWAIGRLLTLLWAVVAMVWCMVAGLRHRPVPVIVRATGTVTMIIVLAFALWRLAPR